MSYQISCFEWYTGLTLEMVKNWDPEGDVGYFVEVDVHVPPELHDKLNDLVPFPEPIEITSELTSDFTQKLQRERFGKLPGSATKLAPNLLPKKRYKCHVMALQEYIRLFASNADIV